MHQKKIKLLTLEAEVEISVRFNEADPSGVVWHGHYLRYFEDVREAFGKKFGLSYLDCYAHGFALPVVKASCDYKRPLRYGEDIIARCKYIVAPAAKMTFEYELFEKGSGQIVAMGTTVQVFVTIANFEMYLTVPDFFEVWKKEQMLA